LEEEESCFVIHFVKKIVEYFTRILLDI